MNGSKNSDLRKSILRESMKLFLANGFRGTSVKEITEAVGIARGTLYWYFKSKDEILKSIFEKFDTEFLDGLTGAVKDDQGSFVTRYAAFHKFASEFTRDHRLAAR